MVYNLVVVTTWFGILGLSWGLLEPIPFPLEIQNCYDYRSYNQTPSPDTAMYIQNMCYRNYQYEQMAAGNVWTGKNLTDEGVSYINSLFRRLLIEADEAEKYHQNGGRQRRQTTPRRFRQEVRSPGGFDPFARCIQRLQNETVEPPSAGRNTYQTFAAFHSGSTLSRAHNGPAFLPWHRIYLLLLETECNTPIPYWDSGLDHDMTDPTMSVLWGPQFFGNGDGDVMNGPFRDVRTILGTPIIRNYGTGNNALFTKEGLQAVLSRRRYADISEPQTAGSIYSLEGHHNGPHVWVGGHISFLNSAPWDPVFYLHHSYCDAVWARFREQQVENGINPETDYPRRPRRGHRPNDVINFGPYFEQVTNLEAMANRFANLVTYEPFPVCENNCNNSPHLYCDQTEGVCISRSRPEALQTLGAMALGVPRGQSFSIQSQTINRAMARGPLPVGQQFGRSPFTDIRNRPDNLETAPAAMQIRRASTQVRSRASRSRVRRDVSQDASFQDSHLQSVSTMQRSFTNTFILDGTVDLKRWAYIPVRVVYSRSHNPQGVDPTLSGALDQANDTCQTTHSGASKVFVASNGLDYYGTYQEFAIIDDRQPVYSTTTAIGIKNPEYGEGKVLFTAHDSCGRPCRPLCLTSIGGHRKYKGCSGAFQITTSSPQMYSLTYRDALRDNLEILNVIESPADSSVPPIAFVCDNVNSWPWEY